MLDEDGVDGLGMRPLAARLGVQAPSLYHHVSGKPALLDSVRDAVLREMRPIAPSASWRTNLAELAREFRRVLSAHPRAAALFATRPSAGARVLALSDAGVGMLVRAGFAPERALAVWQTLAMFVVGHALAGSGDAAGGAAPARLERSLLEPYPALAAAVDAGGSDLDRVFEEGLDAFLRGLQPKERAPRRR